MKSTTKNLQRIIELDSEKGRIESVIFYSLDQLAASIGPCTEILAKIKWTSSIHQAESNIKYFLRLARRMSQERLEAACERVLFYGFDSFDMVRTVLMQRLDSLPLDRNTDIWGQPELF